MTSGRELPASAISGGNPQAKAENETALPHVRTCTAARALDREVECSALARERQPEPSSERFLRHLLAVQTEGQSAETRSGAQRDDPLHDPRPARFDPGARVPTIERLDSRRRQRGQRAPPVVRN